MIQIKQLLKENKITDETNMELAKILNFMDENKIEYDLEPQELIIGEEIVENSTFIKTKGLEGIEIFGIIITTRKQLENANITYKVLDDER